jgi:hypothetical protein
MQLWGIGGEALEGHALHRPLGQEDLDQGALVNRRAIPPDHHAPGHLPRQGFKARDHRRSIERVVLAVDIPLARRDQALMAER